MTEKPITTDRVALGPHPDRPYKLKGREACVCEFDEKFEISVNDMKLGGIDRSPDKYWKNR
jgi:hypothetical protein